LAIDTNPEQTTTSDAVVSLTAKASDKLKEIIAKQGRADLALRVYVTPGGCSGFSYGMTFAEGVEEGDTVIENDGVKVVVDPMSAMYVKGSEIDFVDALMGGHTAALLIPWKLCRNSSSRPTYRPRAQSSRRMAQTIRSWNAPLAWTA